MEKNANTAEKKHELCPGQAYVKGLISNRRRMTGSEGVYWMSIIKMPARDVYAHPSTIEVTSKQPLGDVGQEWIGIVELAGYPRTYNSKPDPETGEIKKINSADNRLRVVES